MELKPGYKQTEGGVIPDTWDVVSIGNLITEFRGGAPLKPSDFIETGVKVLPKGGVGRTGWLRIDGSDQQYCSSAYAASHRRNQVDESFTIVVLRDLVPSGPSIGLMVQIRDHESFVLAQGVYGFKVNAGIVPAYLVQLSNTHWYRKLANSLMVGSTQMHITNTAFKRAQIPLPPVPEQEAIAEALSDADALIESLEQLIAKKRDIKQGAMQELLTGKKRLPGFQSNFGYKQTEVGLIPDDWKPTTIGNIATKVGSGVTPRGGDKNYKGYGRSFIRSQNIGWGTLLLNDLAYIDDKTHNSFPATELMLGDVLLNITGASIGRSALADVRVAGGNVNQHVCIIRTNPIEVSPSFLNYLLLSNVGQQQIDNFQAGGNRQGLNFGQIRSIKFPLPSTYSEQEAIATALSDMDVEIAALEEKLVKARQIKQGMMQELLTGRIRLI